MPFHCNDHMMNEWGKKRVRCSHPSAGCMWHGRGKQLVFDKKTNHFNAGREKICTKHYRAKRKGDYLCGKK